MQGITDELCMLQDTLDKPNNLGDIALVDSVGCTNNTNMIANHGPYCISEDDLDFDRVNSSDDISIDFNIPEKRQGYMSLENIFIGSDRPYPDIECIQDYLKIAHMVKDTGLLNYRGARLPVWDLQIDTWEHHLQGYPCPQKLNLFVGVLKSFLYKRLGGRMNMFWLGATKNVSRMTSLQWISRGLAFAEQ